MRKIIWKIVLVAGLAVTIFGIAVYAFGYQRVYPFKWVYHEAPLSNIVLDPAGQYTMEFMARLNQPPLPPHGEPNPYIHVDYDIVGTVRLYYNDPSSGTVSTKEISGTGSTTFSPSRAASSELVLENIGNAQARIISFHVASEIYVMEQNAQMMESGLALVLVGIVVALIGLIIKVKLAK